MGKAKAPQKPWDKLSESLLFLQPGQCGQCSAVRDLTYWQECDEDDQPTLAHVILCQACADRIIGPHPRLYREIAHNTPMPGVMQICGDCPHRVKARCTCPLARFNGGPGITFEPAPSRIHVCRSPRRLSGWIIYMPHPATSCSGKVK